MNRGELNLEEAEARLAEIATAQKFDPNGFVLAKNGIDNFTFLGPDMVVRIVRTARETPRREIEIALEAIKVGIRTVEPLEWGEDWSIWRRLPGIDAWTFGNLDQVDWNPLIDDLLILHSYPLGPERDVDWEILSMDRYIELLADPIFDKTRNEIERIVMLPRPAGGTFIHGDAHGGNVIVDADGRYLGLIDWGDADWGPKSVEWAHLETQALDLLMFRSEVHIDPMELAQFKIVRALRLARAEVWPKHSILDSLGSCRKFGL